MFRDLDTYRESAQRALRARQVSHKALEDLLAEIKEKLLAGLPNYRNMGFSILASVRNIVELDLYEGEVSLRYQNRAWEYLNIRGDVITIGCQDGSRTFKATPKIINGWIRHMKSLCPKWILEAASE